MFEVKTFEIYLCNSNWEEARIGLASHWRIKFLLKQRRLSLGMEWMTQRQVEKFDNEADD